VQAVTAASSDHCAAPSPAAQQDDVLDLLAAQQATYLVNPVLYNDMCQEQMARQHQSPSEAAQQQSVAERAYVAWMAAERPPSRVVPPADVLLQQLQELQAQYEANLQIYHAGVREQQQQQQQREQRQQHLYESELRAYTQHRQQQEMLWNSYWLHAIQQQQHADWMRKLAEWVLLFLNSNLKLLEKYF
jgi:hypothetical protein